MVRSVVIPTLSDKAYVESTRTVLARILGYYIATNYGQSMCFKRDLISLSKTYHEYINNPEEMGKAVELDITNLLKAYYEHVEVETVVRFDETNTKADIGLYATVVDDFGVKVGLGKVVDVDPTGLGNIIDVNNFGEAKRLIRR